MTGSIHQISPTVKEKEAEPQLGFCSKLKHLAEIIVQIVVRILFVALSIAMAAVALPLSWHAVALPIVASGTTALAAFFFLRPNPISSQSLNPILPLIHAVPPKLPADAPRGIRNECSNCAINAVTQLFISDPGIAEWLRNPLPLDMDRAAFRKFLDGYNAPAQLVADFLKYLDAQEALQIGQEERPSIPQMFSDFIRDFIRDYGSPAQDQTPVIGIRNSYEPVITNPPVDMPNFITLLKERHNPPPRLIADFTAYFENYPYPPIPIPRMFGEFIQAPNYVLREWGNPGERAPIIDIKDRYQHLMIFQDPYRKFLAAYDRALKENHPVAEDADSQSLRLAASQFVVDVSPHSNQQVDPQELAISILSTLPNSQKIRIQTACRYDETNLPPMQDPPVPDLEEWNPFLKLTLGEDSAHTLEGLLKENHDYESREGYYLGTDGNRHQYPMHTTVSFLEAPPALRLHIVRDRYDPVSKSNQKRNDPVRFPTEITITPVHGEARKYRLVSFVNHNGKTGNSGHYVAARIVNGQKYFMDDTRVTLASQAEWEQRLLGAYLVCYLPVE